MNSESDAMTGTILREATPKNVVDRAEEVQADLLANPVLKATQLIDSSREQLEHNPTTPVGSQWPQQPAVRKTLQVARTTRVKAGPGVPSQMPRVVLVGDRHTLRALRAAEMAVWNTTSTAPKQTPTQAARADVRKSGRLPASPPQQNESWMLAILGLSALAAVCLGIEDMNALLKGWTHMANGIRALLF